MYVQAVMVHSDCSNLTEVADEIIDAIAVELIGVETTDGTGDIRMVVVYVDADDDEVI